jgi:eukaryotic-like serine/threonine-protein kinase
MLAMLNHPAIPDVSDYFTEGNRSYLVLELIRGKDLQNWLEEHEELVSSRMH